MRGIQQALDTRQNGEVERDRRQKSNVKRTCIEQGEDMIALLSRKSTKAERTSGGENDQYSEKLSYLNNYRAFSRYELLVFKILRSIGDEIRSGLGSTYLQKTFDDCLFIQGGSIGSMSNASDCTQSDRRVDRPAGGCGDFRDLVSI